ncbi:MAG TPA: LysR family transcriptional regulator [Ramlibacter sp.]|nr:LysR family transcriptional regulator [Ramlibacter sp.]
MPVNLKLNSPLADASLMLTEHQKRSASIERFFRSRLRLSQLRVLSALGELGQLKKVADALSVTPSAISKQLAEIEDALDAPLFERAGNRVRFTDLGRVLTRRAQEMIEQLERTRIEIDHLCTGESGSIGVGAAPTLSPLFLPRLVLDLKIRAPHAFFKFQEGRFERLGPMLEDATLDVVIARELLHPLPMGFVQEEVMPDPIVVACGTQHPLATRSRLTWKDLKGAPWILPAPGSSTHAPLEALMTRNGLQPPPGCVESISLEVNVALLEGHPFVALFPLSYVRRRLDTHRIVVLPLSTEGMQGAVKAVWRKDNPNPMLEPMLASIRRHASQL